MLVKTHYQGCRLEYSMSVVPLACKYNLANVSTLLDVFVMRIVLPTSLFNGVLMMFDLHLINDVGTTVLTYLDVKLKHKRLC